LEDVLERKGAWLGSSSRKDRSRKDGGKFFGTPAGGLHESLLPAQRISRGKNIALPDPDALGADQSLPGIDPQGCCEPVISRVQDRVSLGKFPSRWC
jgi:hypothetical protein